MSETKKGILVLRTGNSARSQMAEGLLRAALGPGYEVHSAGTHPSIVRPEAIAVLAEVGSISRGTARSRPAQTTLIHNSFDDPAFVSGDDETRLAAFRKVRDEIRQFIETDLRTILNSETTDKDQFCVGSKVRSPGESGKGVKACIHNV